MYKFIWGKFSRFDLCVFQKKSSLNFFIISTQRFSVISKYRKSREDLLGGICRDLFWWYWNSCFERLHISGERINWSWRVSYIWFTIHSRILRLGFQFGTWLSVQSSLGSNSGIDRYTHNSRSSPWVWRPNRWSKARGVCRSAIRHWAKKYPFTCVWTHP